jgi:hypothetical protein
MMDAWTQLTHNVTEAIERMVTARLERVLDKYFRSTLKVIYTEDEAAVFLGVGVETLASWRSRGLIECARYPVGRLREGQEDGLGRTYTYDIAQLLSFRDRYKQRIASPAKYEIQPVVSLLGPELRSNEPFMRVGIKESF